jgi:hypothetical protein
VKPQGWSIERLLVTACGHKLIVYALGYRAFRCTQRANLRTDFRGTTSMTDQTRTRSLISSHFEHFEQRGIIFLFSKKDTTVLFEGLRATTVWTTCKLFERRTVSTYNIFGKTDCVGWAFSKTGAGLIESTVTSRRASRKIHNFSEDQNSGALPRLQERRLWGLPIFREASVRFPITTSGREWPSAHDA